MGIIPPTYKISNFTGWTPGCYQLRHYPTNDDGPGFYRHRPGVDGI